MGSESDEAKTVLKSLWTSDTPAEFSVDEDCSPTKSCKNMKDVTFDGYAPRGSDLRTAWREKLAREGKLRSTNESIRDIVLGDATESAEVSG